MPPPSSRIQTVDALRGIASFCVAWFHFTNGNGAFLPVGFLKSSGRYGWLGVQMFFVISGFVIPHALYKAQYQLPQYGRFLAKRIIRLDPPYIVDICLVLALAYLVPLVPMYHGIRPSYSFTQLLGHVGYANTLIGKPWINPVFWSLGIEFQYYLLIGLIFPLLVAPNRLIRLASMVALLLPAFFIPRPSLIFTWLPLFVAGILIFQKRVGQLSGGFFVAGLAVVFSIVWAEGRFGIAEGGLPSAIVMLLTALAIAFVTLRFRVLNWLGLISYSLYLVHVPIGGKVVNLGARYAHRLHSEIIVLFLACLASLFAAYLLYRAVELPSQRLSSKISYRRPVERGSEGGVLKTEALNAQGLVAHSVD
jgi:peptidoglycan/LPS O-acetylase OafA/YrhL